MNSTGCLNTKVTFSWYREHLVECRSHQKYLRGRRSAVLPHHDTPVVFVLHAVFISNCHSVVVFVMMAQLLCALQNVISCLSNVLPVLSDSWKNKIHVVVWFELHCWINFFIQLSTELPGSSGLSTDWEPRTERSFNQVLQKLSVAGYFYESLPDFFCEWNVLQ